MEQATFHCPFESIKRYPFEIQTCNFLIKVEGPDKFYTKLTAQNLTVSPSSQIGQVKGQYVISDWDIEETKGKVKLSPLSLMVMRELEM